MNGYGLRKTHRRDRKPMSSLIEAEARIWDDVRGRRLRGGRSLHPRNNGDIDTLLIPSNYDPNGMSFYPICTGYWPGALRMVGRC